MNNILHTKLTYTGSTFDLTYFNGTKVDDVKNTLMIFDVSYISDITNEYGISNNINDILDSANYITQYYGLYWVNEASLAYLVNTPCNNKLYIDIDTTSANK